MQYTTIKILVTVLLEKLRRSGGRCCVCVRYELKIGRR